jgi:hypothetical protein
MDGTIWTIDNMRRDAPIAFDQREGAFQQGLGAGFVAMVEPHFAKATYRERFISGVSVTPGRVEHFIPFVRAGLPCFGLPVEIGDSHQGADAGLPGDSAEIEDFPEAGAGFRRAIQYPHHVSEAVENVRAIGGAQGGLRQSVAKHGLGLTIVAVLT